MWVLSQNEEVLINCDSFSIIEEKHSYEIITRNILSCDCYTILGRYDSKEKAVAVLNEIVNTIEINESIFKEPTMQFDERKMRNYFVYKMPKK